MPCTLSAILPTFETGRTAQEIPENDTEKLHFYRPIRLYQRKRQKGARNATHDSIVLLESMQDGVLYSNILLKLYLKSLKHGGRLQLDEDIPYTAQMIATITRQQIGTVERALQIFLKLGLVEVLDSGTFYMQKRSTVYGSSGSAFTTTAWAPSRFQAHFLYRHPMYR